MNTIQNSAWVALWRRVLGSVCWVQTPADKQVLLAAIRSSSKGGIRIAAFVNAHAMNMASENTDFAEHLANSNWLLRDGAGMQILARLLHQSPGLNMNGTDFIPEVLAAFTGSRVALWGTTEPYLAEATKRLTNEYQFKVVSAVDGFQTSDVYLAEYRKSQPNLILLGMGMPKQERVAVELKNFYADAACIVICGGAILDFFGGKVDRAPKAFRSFGVEWAYRLILEPKRLFKRYVVGNPVFIFRSIVYMMIAKRK